jgi:hypothetical protein
MKTASELRTVIALRNLGLEREILVLKCKGQDFYALLPAGESGQGDCRIHFSLHESGERHVVAESRGCDGKWREDKWLSRGAEPATMRKQTKTQLQRPAALKDALLLARCSILYGQFRDLRPIGANRGELIVLDAEAAHFRDDFTIASAYVVEPGCEDSIVVEPSMGPRILHFEKRTNPWMAVEIFQQA